MKETKTVKFKVSSIDSLCQGVSKVNDSITFIGKTLPGEEGEAVVYSSKKNVSFAKVKSISKKSPQRQEANCPHFIECGGCQLLHTDYENELEIKKSSLLEIFMRQHKIDISDKFIQISAPRRNLYRNRIQLQYDKRRNLIGFRSEDSKSIIPVQKCDIAIPEVRDLMLSLYSSDWKKFAKKANGHVEIYKKGNEVKTTWDSRYAHEGFSQVFKEMNDRLLALLCDPTLISKYKGRNIVDLFGGNGNLSAFFDGSSLVIDGTPEKFINLVSPCQSYKQINLYADDAVSIFKDAWKEFKDDNSLLIVDPPRSGIKNLDEFAQACKPAEIIYVSCNPQTLARDLKTILQDFSISKIYQLDFFPGTRHYETVVFLGKK
ncbi:class I SAM-dependent RNA methyltransferase [Bacteriovorax sp. Seq25_V]|uniref:class I SAM-dependent RNA methyltransferase n=1 Tax=Bacteriovorax sp. Seq25_V TaxID=1201288 RepID=UPI000389FE2E|nr:class I SAM-dependent RNA methyltransferase [Bacteriovorax sp. Seq25_V]EQC44751.1 tRNA (Uracil-5-)-methyltransferase domain protein [Bacteriovorax sp. Seq25_V]